ncbi:SpoIIE family protein phosphatase [Labilibacter marinus]|uniref:SpoIIE family protein phosphatase n=1 Tax=Labilibacter marinus TaxID=1477105 RepID=UPI00094FFB2C|nr:SpoIIE family protein phosphatase [Labilibacter marinus]
MLYFLLRVSDKGIRSSHPLYIRSLVLLISVLLFTSPHIYAQNDIFDANGNKINKEAAIKRVEEQIKLGDYKEASRHLNAIAEGYWNGKDYYNAIEYYIKSIRLNEKINNQSGIGSISSNLGMIHSDLKDYENALKYFNTSIQIRKDLHEVSGLISSHINASVVLNNLTRYDESIINLNQALLLSTQISDADRMKSCYGMLAETYEKKGDGEKMIEYYNLYRTFHELVTKNQNERVLEQALESELKAQFHEAQKRIKELELINAQRQLAEKERVLTRKDTVYQELMAKYTKSELANTVINKNLKLKDLRIFQSIAKLKREQLFVRVLIFSIIAVCLLLTLLFYSHQQKRKSNKLLTKRNEEVNRQHDEIVEQQKELERYYNIITLRNEHITSSISYAKLIQQAVIGRKENFNDLFNDAFIFFRPKDIVSGDFYWFKKVNGYSMFAVVDCTGHGVPGAFMSMLGINLINQITNSGIHEVDEILNHLNAGVNEALNSSANDNVVSRDGMDISLVCIDEANKLMYFSGAKHSLYYIQDKKLQVLKGDRCSIGSIDYADRTKKRYTKQQVDISKPTSIYAFSDGIVDQFNENDDKKFLRSRLRALLLKVHLKPAPEQKEMIAKAFTDWKGKQTQTDDILLLGVQLALTYKIAASIHNQIDFTHNKS